VRDTVNLSFGLVLAVLLANAALLYSNVHRLAENNAAVERAHKVLDGLDDVLATLIDAETSQRGFLLTGREPFLEPYRQAVRNLPGHLANLQGLTAADADQRQDLRLVDREARDRLDMIEGSVQRRRRPEWALDEAESNRLFQGKQAMDAVRATVAAMRDREQRALHRRAEESAASESVTVLTLIVMAVLSVVLLVVAYALVRRQDAQKRRAAEHVRQERERLEVTLLGIGDGVLATDAAGRVLLLNPVARQLTGWTREEAAGRPVTEVVRLLDANTRQPVASAVEKALRENVAVGPDGHRLIVARDGTERAVDENAAPIHSTRGEVVGAVLVIRDVTLQRRLQQQLQERVEELAQADRRKDEFLALLAHELRNPLAPIRTALHILRLKQAEPAVVEDMRALMERQTAHLVRLVDDLLDVSRISRGKIDLRREPLELARVVSRAVESVRPLVDERRLRLDVHLPPAPLRLDGDQDRLVQVLTNLLGNAVRYTEPGGHITLTATAEENEAVVRVRDTGIGIRPEMLPRIFDMFQQADRVPGRAAEGLGLGLTLVKNLVEMHGGRVLAQSEGPGHGSEFVVRLPLSGHEAPAAAPAAPAGGLRILIVDDNVDGAESLALLLRSEGHRPDVAHDGVMALAQFDRVRPQVVFLDIELPGGTDGYELAQQMRQRPAAAEAVFIALTGYGREADRRRSAEAGFAAHLVKPVDLAVLQQVLRWPRVS
jgi:PAS domain S-box-containing protein